MFIIFSGVFSAEKKVTFRPGAKPMRNELRQFIGVGMAITKAETLMTANGFACKRKVNEDFLATDKVSTDSKFIQRKNFLYCDHTEPGYSAISPARRWKVALINEAEKVALVLVSYEEIAP
jgi:hypothetical protein